MVDQCWVEKVFVGVVEYFFVDYYVKGYVQYYLLEWDCWWQDQGEQDIGDEEVFVYFVVVFLCEQGFLEEVGEVYGGQNWYIVDQVVQYVGLEVLVVEVGQYGYQVGVLVGDGVVIEFGDLQVGLVIGVVEVEQDCWEGGELDCYYDLFQVDIVVYVGGGLGY